MRRICLAITLVVAGAASVAAQADHDAAPSLGRLAKSRAALNGGTSETAIEFPDTPAGRRGKEVLQLLNGEGALTPRDYANQNWSEAFKRTVPENSRGAAIAQIRSMAGKLDLTSITRSEPLAIEFVVQSASTGMSFAVSITVEKEPPHLISSMRLAPGGPTAATVPPPAPRAGAGDNPDVEQIRKYLAEQARLGRFSGSALIAKDGKTLLHETAGYANKRFSVLNKPDTKFNLASLNKSFTAVAVLQLVEAGKIGIDDPIGRYLDGFPPSVAEKVTIRHLLNMTSGWGDYWGNEYYLAHKDELRSVSDYLRFIKNIPLSFEPGSNSQHSNIGFEVAGAVIEKVTGMDYFDYVRARIYRPAGMENTDTYHRDGPVANLATGYTNGHPLDTGNSGREWENTYILSPRGTPAGGGYSTAEDMLRYDAALRTGRLVGAKYVDFMSNQYRGTIGDSFVQQRVPRGAGGALGASTFYARDHRNGYTIIVLTNHDNPIAIDIGNEIIRLLRLE